MLVSKRNFKLSNVFQLFQFSAKHHRPLPSLPPIVIFPSYITLTIFNIPPRTSHPPILRIPFSYFSAHFRFVRCVAARAPATLYAFHRERERERERKRDDWTASTRSMCWLSYPFLVDPYLQPVCRGKSCRLGVVVDTIFWG